MKIVKSILSGGKSDLKKTIKDNPELLDDIENVKDLFQNGLKDLDKIKADFPEFYK